MRGDGEAERAAEARGAGARCQRVGTELVDFAGEPAVVRVGGCGGDVRGGGVALALDRPPLRGNV